MKYSNKLAGLLSLLFACLSTAQAAPIVELRVTGGQFHMGPTFSAAGPSPYTFTDSTLNLITDFPTNIGWDVNAGQTSPATGSVVSFIFGGPFVNTFIVECDPGQLPGEPLGTGVDDCQNFPHTQPTGTVNGGNNTISDGDPIVVDTNGLYANWNGTDFNQGGTSGSGIAYPGSRVEFPFDSTVSNVVGDTFDYTMTWQALIVGGPFNGQTGTWTFTGTGRVNLAAPSNLPATEPLLTLSASNFTNIIEPATTIDTMFPLPDTHDACTTCWDFMVTNLAANGDSAKVVIPLNSVIVDDAEILKYNTTTDIWSAYDTTTDTLSSALSVGGLCPIPGDSAFVSPPQAGHDCLQLDIMDGGANDDDGNPNSVLVDPGGVFLPRAAKEPTILNDNSACSLSTNGGSPARAADWLLVAGFLGWLGWKRRKSSLH